MRYLLVLVSALLYTVNAQTPDVAGLVTVPSQNDFATTVEQLGTALSENDLKVVATIDHAANARSAELTLRPTTLFIFGNPQAGTPLMQMSQTTAIDLPQKMLVWEDETGAVLVSYNDPVYLGERHGLGDEAGLGAVADALAGLAEAATQ